MPIGCAPSHAMHTPLLSKPWLLFVFPSTAFSLFYYASIVQTYFLKQTRFISTSKDFTFLWMFYHFLSTFIPTSIFISKTPFSRNFPLIFMVWVRLPLLILPHYQFSETELITTKAYLFRSCYKHWFAYQSPTLTFKVAGSGTYICFLPPFCHLVH